MQTCTASVAATAALALELVRQSCSSDEIKSAARAAGLGSLIFQPQKKFRVWEELFCVSAAMAGHAISSTTANPIHKKLARMRFEIEALEQLRKLLGSEADAVQRFHEKIRKYRVELDSGIDAIGLSSTFVANLQGLLSPHKAPLSLAPIPFLISMHVAMTKTMASIQIVSDEDD